MCATRTQDIEATVGQAKMLHDAGAGLVRIAIDSTKDVEALAEIRARVPEANLVVDLQENYRLVAQVAPHVSKVRYNPGHLYHHEKQKSARDKVAFIAETAARLRNQTTLMTINGIRTLQHNPGYNSAKAVAELGVTFRPLAETLRDEVAWYRSVEKRAASSAAPRPRPETVGKPA
jgi:hypothetical protein